MSEAEKRLENLLDRWLETLDLHTRYLKLDDAAYAQVQSWPKHQRPNKWIIELARQRVDELRFHVKERKELGDDEFAEALELMGFLTSLLATEHIERFIPLAVPPKETTIRQQALSASTASTGTARARMATPARAGAPKPAPAPVRAVAPRPATRSAATVTSRRLPPQAASAGSPKSTSGSAAAAKPAPQSSASRAAASRPNARAAGRPAPREPVAAPARLSERMVNLIVADAVRLLAWGSEWPQLAGLIARLADRPSERQIWDVLSQHRATIESRARQRGG